MKIGKILLISGLALGGLYLIGKNKIAKWTEIMNKLKTVPSGIRNIKIANWMLKFDLDVTLYNNTMDDLNPVAGLVNLQKFVISDKNKNQLAQVLVNQSSINIKAGQSQEFKNLKVEIPLNLNNITTLSKITSTADIKVYAVAVTPFKTFFIEQ